MSGVLTGFGVLIAVVALGWLLGRRSVLGPDASTVLSKLSFFVATPALLVTTLAESDLATAFSSSLLVNAGAVVGVAVLAGLMLGLARKRPLGHVTVGMLASTYVNAGNLGIAIAAYVLGDTSYVALALLFQLLVMAPLGLAVLDASTAGRRSVMSVVLQPVRTPVTIACAVGLLLNVTDWQLPEVVLRPVELVGATAVPAGLLAFGMALAGSALPGRGPDSADVWTLVLLKNLVHPLLAYALGRLLGLDSVALLAVTVNAALPTATNVFVYAATFGQAPAMARDTMVLTTLLSLPVLVAVAALAI
jgi:malonate transporter